jgi:hypothetical protein
MEITVSTLAELEGNDLEEQNPPHILYCNMEYPFFGAFVAFFYMFKYHSLKTSTPTATQ